MRDKLAYWLLILAAKLTRWGDPYDSIMAAAEMQKRYVGYDT